MKKLLSLICCCAIAAGAENIPIYPERMVYGMAGFEKWQCGKDAITAVQTRGYSWSATVPVEFTASGINDFNVVLAADQDINAKLTIYFRRKGEKSFDKASFCRKNFTAKANEAQLVTIPMQ